MTRHLYQTPPNLPEGTECRTLEIPDSLHWLGIFNAALLTLLNSYNWEQVSDTDLTIDETMGLIRPMITAYWDTLDCGGSGGECTLPDGGRILRLGVDGHIQQLTDGEWIEPTDDYTVPPVPGRGEATEEDRLCAAAANAEYCLRLLYEEVTDLAAGTEGTLEEIAAIVTFLIAEVGLWLGLAFATFAPLLIAAFIAFIEIAVFVTADLWDGEFTGILRCLLLLCASDDGEVVTFNYDCLVDQLAHGVDLLDPDGLNQLRLFGQIRFILSCIGVDGLNAMGGTTAIVDPDCICGIHCYTIDFRLGNGASQGWINSGGTYAAGVGWNGINGGASSLSDVTGYWNFGTDVYVTEIRMIYNKNGGAGANNVNKLNALDAPVSNYATTQVHQDNSNPTSSGDQAKFFAVNDSIRGIGVDINTGTYAGTARLIKLEVYYSGDIHTGWTDNCDDI